MGPAVYILGSLTTLICAVLLLRGYFRSRTRLLLWSALCFFGLAFSNLLTFLDLVLLPNIDLYLWRLSTAAVAMLILVYGLIWEGE
ncbi:MAG TPA: DUF5985 family protein [Candidatus Acidoferrales bacterium]|nr:DUF5985 family protein [Candidatus Acidoferrales bacterium]